MSVNALRKALNWIDSVPSDTPLPAMPGFDRDWVEALMSGHPEEDVPLTIDEALEMAVEWIAAVPADIRASLPHFGIQLISRTPL